jgi:formylglycine-generating enzyme required for sulfatase activity
MTKKKSPPTHIDRQINAHTYIEQHSGAPEMTELRANYLNRLAAQVKGLPLSGIDPKAASVVSADDLQLSAVYTALMTEQILKVYESVDVSMPNQNHKAVNLVEARRLSAIEVLNQEKQLVLLGDPGSGKSTFVNFVTLCLAGEALQSTEANLAVLTAPLPTHEKGKKPEPQPWRHNNLLPVLILLRDLAARLPSSDQPVDAETLWNFVVEGLGALKDYAPALKRELLDTGGLILLDGLDEVPDADQRRTQIKQIVQDFSRTFHRCRFLVTSRTYAYQRQDWKLDGFAEAVLSPFTPDQIEYFIDHWYQHVGSRRGLDRADEQGKALQLKTAIERSERLQALAEQPLLLTLMASLHSWRGGSLPEKREELYASAVDLLLNQWEGQKTKRRIDGTYEVLQPSLAEWLKIDRDNVRRALERLAFEGHRDQPELIDTADIAQSKLVDALLKVANNPDVRPQRLIEFLRDRAGLLIARGEGVYALPHRTFQEYLAACYSTDHGFPDELAELTRGEVNRWREVTLLAGAKAARGTTSAAWMLAEALCYKKVPRKPAEALAYSALLAAQILIENDAEHVAQPIKRNASKLALIHNWLRAILERGWLPPLDRAQVGNVLAVLGDDRDFDQLIDIPAGSFLMGSSDVDKLAYSDEKPQHEITLPDYKIGKYPVTNSQYRRFVKATQRDWDSAEGRLTEKANHPAVNVSWHDACAYCDWSTEVWRQEKKITLTELVRLPTEAEWEKAARGGLSPVSNEGDREGRIWPWGNEWDETQCNNGGLNLNDTSSVGIFPNGASPYGCCDMVGNVWEWTGTEKRNYPYHFDDGREDLAADDNVLRVLRGGAFNVNRYRARCACRFGNTPVDRYRLRGFRVAVSPRSPL